MKKILSMLLVVVLVLSALVITGCTEKAEDVKLGLGVVATATALGAEGEDAGNAELEAVVAAVLVNKEGKIVACTIDETYENMASVSATGVITTPESFKTKNELGTAYGMSEAGKTEWNVQASAFAGVCVGKTADEVKALVVNGYQPSDEVKAAGCTVAVSGMANAVVKAVANATVEGAVATDKVDLGVVTTVKTTEAEKAEFTITVVAAAKANGKITAMLTDEIVSTFEVTETGDVIAPSEVKTKNELGTAYGMSEAGKTEWNVQAEAFSKACVGKDAEGIGALVVNGYQPSEEVKAAGCTIAVTNMVKAAVKAAR